ncbi:metal-dependent transcriptional regulator [Clostridium rectalis]|uniref:metal-dependent transcriptional regulator n=1 Tax=Clostridium rectalis TaxID=2040295 RepID=UPI001FAAB071|nr:iron dependent repressor, metal binding and dimerization domain protein [Clostridium rectalis]
MGNNENFYTVRGYEILNKEDKILTKSMEDYLEMIYRKSLKKEEVRINTLAKSLNVKPPSTTKMVQKLTQLGFLDYKKYGSIKLTDRGRKMGGFLLKRHNIIQEFLKNLDVKNELLVNIELIEHNITKEALNSIQILNKFFSDNPCILENFNEYKDDFIE